MKMERPCEGLVLLVGDGDFSFSLSLLKNSAISATQVTTSNLETTESIQLHKLASENMSLIKSIGATVLLEVDARELHLHPIIRQKVYSRIIFNFPLADRHNIKKNRSLLADFFSSCTFVLAPRGQVMVTLCKGQGGTPADQQRRSWHDSWQVLAMAANSGFVLSDVTPFEASRFPEYHSVGFRFQDKSFDTGNSLTHVFEMAETVSVRDELLARGVLQHDGETYSCSHYIAEGLKRNLLKEESSPVFWVRQELEQSLGQTFPCQVLPDDVSSEVILPGHKSLVCVVHCGDGDSPGHGAAEAGGDLTLSAGPAPQDALTEQKRQKDEANLTRKQDMAAAAGTAPHFAHGVDGGDGPRGGKDSSNSGERPPPFTGLLPLRDDAVSVLIKTSSSRHKNASNGAQEASEETGSVFHHRSSMLENLASLCSAVDAGFVHEPTHEEGVPGQGDREPGSTSGAIIVSGQCCFTCPILPHFLPIRHELVFISRVSQCLTSALSYEKMAESVISCLQASAVFGGRSKLELRPCQKWNSVSILAVDKVSAVSLIQVQGTSATSVSHPVGLTLKVEQDTGHVCVVLLNLDAIACHVWHIPDPRLLWSQTDKIVCQLSQFSSSSSSSSSSPSLTSEAAADSSSSSPSPSSSCSLFQPISLYPMKFVHDLSFWETSSDTSSSFDELELLAVVRCVAGDAVVLMTLVDTYDEPGTGRRSRCYRLHFQSHDQAFPYAVSWKLQSQIRVEVARKLGVKLR